LVIHRAHLAARAARWLSLALLMSALLNATPITWYLENASLVSGGVLTGSFTYDATTGTLSNNVYLVSTQDGAVLAPQTWDSGNLYPGTGYALPTAIQLVNTNLYGITLDFSSPLTNSGGTIDFPTGGSLICNLSAGGCDLFQSGEVTSQVAALINFEGGSTSMPVLLPGGEPVSEVTGTIGGLGSQDYYTFGWNGGAFSATAAITGTPNAGASYLYSVGAAGTCSDGGTQTLNSGDGFMSTIDIGNLAAGQYCIGIAANSSNDPDFALTFNTPVGTATPEPATFVLLSTALATLGLFRFVVQGRGGSKALLVVSC